MPLRSPAPKPSLAHDFPAGLVVFLVALPLCLGIALASGAPLLSGLIAGVVGGLVIPLVSRAQLSVSGPAAGLAAVVLAGIHHFGFPAVCAATMLAGALQIALGQLRAGFVVSFVQGSVIRGMLAAIGILLILKQVPNAFGYVAPEGGFSFAQLGSSVQLGAVIISISALVIMWAFEHFNLKKTLPYLPAALVVVVVGVALTFVFGAAVPELSLAPRFLVSVPEGGFAAITANAGAMDLTALLRPEVLVFGVTLAVVASLESLLSLDAIDKLDPYKRRSDSNRELVAQGLGNIVSGFLGGLPVTSVIVRSSANVDSGGRTRLAAIAHGALLLVATLFLASLLNRIPLAALAGILLWTGLKLARPALIRQMWKRGLDQFVPFLLTILAIVFTDLLRGVVIGILIGQLFNIRSAMKNAFEVEDGQGIRTIRFAKDIFFFHKAGLLAATESFPKGTTKVVVDLGAADFVELDVRESLYENRANVERGGAKLEFLGITPTDAAPAH
jgi:MFS superfamily sulfate permease-like transporter